MGCDALGSRASLPFSWPGPSHGVTLCRLGVRVSDLCFALNLPVFPSLVLPGIRSKSSFPVVCMCLALSGSWALIHMCILQQDAYCIARSSAGRTGQHNVAPMSAKTKWLRAREENILRLRILYIYPVDVGASSRSLPIAHHVHEPVRPSLYD